MTEEDRLADICRNGLRSAIGGTQNTSKKLSVLRKLKEEIEQAETVLQSRNFVMDIIDRLEHYIKLTSEINALTSAHGDNGYASIVHLSTLQAEKMLRTYQEAANEIHPLEHLAAVADNEIGSFELGIDNVAEVGILFGSQRYDSQSKVSQDDLPF